jgi:hypothetical protein
MSQENVMNYSLGVLIVLLMVFWFMCKCIGNSGARMSEGMQDKQEPAGGFYYGNSPLYLGTPTGTRYIKINKKNVVEVPNSKTAMRHLFDDEAYKCQTLDTFEDFDQAPSDIFMAKNAVRDRLKDNRPTSMTATRENMCSDRHTRIPMGSY